MKTIGLLGCGGNAGINFVKSLKIYNPNIKVIGFDLDKYNLVSCNADVKIHLNFHNIDDKIKKINSFINEYKIDFLHAQPDPEVRFLCEHSHLLDCKVFDHSLEEWKQFSDKLYCAKRWKKTMNLEFSSHSLEKVLIDNSLWNSLCTTNKVWCRSIRGAGSKAALPVSSIEQAESWANYWINNRGAHLEDFMLSEYLPGREFAVQTFWRDGELLHSQARERLVYFFGSIMPSGQSSTPAVARTVNEDNVYITAHKAIKSISEKPHGIYCVDLKENKNKSIIPMEVNYGRFFTTNDFFSNVGVNTPATYVFGLEDKKINSLDQDLYWIRGLDKEPYLHKGKL